MGTYFIPSCKPVNFPTSTPSSKPSRRWVDPCAVETLSLLLRPCAPSFIRRVTRTWWSSRSSKPLPRHSVPGGRFDSYPLRHSFGRGPSLHSGFRLRALAVLTPAKRLKFDSYPLRHSFGRGPSLRSGFCLRALAALTPAKRLKFDSYPLRGSLRRLARCPLYVSKGGDGACHASRFES
jgi:hypothetical protein